ncbi:MAG: esterase [Terriglobia bacterium]|nr:MAG: esterase [Terriglobia bacterium]
MSEDPSYGASLKDYRVAQGTLRLHNKFASQFLSTRRDLIVYLPPGYEESTARYPVFYLQDGQNLFDPVTAFNGQTWGADATADDLIARGRIQPVILAGIYNTGVRRISEYTPTRDRQSRKGGKAVRYAQMLAREIKPFIDHEYRTRKGAADTAVGGSSLGALASLVTGLEYPRVFGGMAMLSPSVWWDGRSILSMVRAYRSRIHGRIWLDIGTAEGSNPSQIVEDARLLRDALIERGWSDLRYCEAEGADHSERAWAARFGSVLEYLFPPR